MGATHKVGSTHKYVEFLFFNPPHDIGERPCATLDEIAHEELVDTFRCPNAVAHGADELVHRTGSPARSENGRVRSLICLGIDLDAGLNHFESERFTFLFGDFSYGDEYRIKATT